MKYPENPPLECDVIMKGGITSGVIYPRTVCELAKSYRLRSVGGSSAGAIAAAGAAAAELGRSTGGFDQLETLPNDITAASPAGGSTLFRLFQPTKATYPLYRAFTAGMGKSSKTLPAVFALLAGFWLWAFAGAVPGIVVVVVSAFGSGPACVAGMAGGLILALLGLILGIALGVIKMLAGVSGADFGLCTGMPGAGAKGAPALTPWLHDRLQSMAGRANRKVLTFGDLAARDVELRTMTTNLTRRQPMAMPWTTQEYFFDPAEMRRLFPEDVVKWMEEHPPAAAPDGSALAPSEIRERALLRAQAEPKRPFPAPQDVPVIVATRMSLSFPLLITAVPLYAVDYSREVNREAREAADAWLAANPDRPATEGAASAPKRSFGVNWFSDGGICANLPVQFFDAPLPTRPTFAVDLEQFPPDRQKSPVESENCYLPATNSAGLLRPWTAIPTSGIGALGAFFNQIVDTARSWVDAAQLVLPGYRDRVVTIYHDSKEGGMNLAMPAPIVADLADRGEAAGAMLVERFVGPEPKRQPAWGWNNQRWIRFRTATAGLDAWLTKFQGNYSAAAPGAIPYADLAGPNTHAPLPSYAFSNVGARSAVNDHTAQLLAMAARWGSDNAMLDNAPQPRPVMRLVPADGTPTGLADHATETPTDEQAVDV
jgi:predicted acylesterase/phospholipase RssA